MPPAARVGDMHSCPMVTGIVPHVGGPILPPGVPTVLIGGMPAAVVSSMCTCAGPPDTILKGSLGVMIGGMPAARMGDLTAHGGSIVVGLPTVLIGDISIAELEAIIDAINPTNSVINCGFLVDAAIARLTGTDPTATAPAGQDGSFDQIAARHGAAPFQWGHSVQDAFDAVRDGGDGTIAMVGIDYGNGGSHIVAMTNHDGQVAITEAQDWGGSNPREVITSPDRANQRYNSTGGSDFGYTIVRTGH